MQNNKKEEFDVHKFYGEDCTINSEDFKTKYKVSENGLSSSQAQENIRNLGFNQIKQSKPKRWYNYFFSSLFSPFNSILLGISFILVYTDIILPENPSPANIIVILSLIIIDFLFYNISIC